MEIIEETYGDLYEHSSHNVTLKTDSGEEKSVRFSDGEPEDMYLARELGDALRIGDMLKIAYQAGRDGEELTETVIKEDYK